MCHHVQILFHVLIENSNELNRVTVIRVHLVDAICQYGMYPPFHAICVAVAALMREENKSNLQEWQITFSSGPRRT